MNKLILILAILCISSSGMAQFNDTIFYKSGMEKVVEISDFTDGLIKYTKVNGKGATVDSQISMNVVSRFVMYDEEGILQYDSKIKAENSQIYKMQRKYPTSVSVSKHQISINPFFLPFLSFNGKYNYRFGNKMQYSICSRLTYISPLADEFGDRSPFLVGAGFQFTPFYNDHFAFGLDFTPIIGFNSTGFSDSQLDDFNIMLPISIDVDFYFNETVGISTDLGFGHMFGDGSSSMCARGHIGVSIRFKDKKTFDTNYR